MRRHSGEFLILFQVAKAYGCLHSGRVTRMHSLRHHEVQPKAPNEDKPRED
jgi:hypothetical protein